MRRITEPELMLEEEQVRAYADAEFAEPHDHFVALLGEKLPSLPDEGFALDFGCGAGDISRRFAHARPGWRVHGIDGSGTMLRIAREYTAADGLADRVGFDEVLLPAAPTTDAVYDIVFSNSLLHHLADPAVFWTSLRDWARPDGRVFVMDLTRPPTRDAASELVRQHAADEPEILRTDFFNSLLAAFELEEIERQLAAADLDHLQVEAVSDRHCIVWGRIGG